ncbi:hypothetical protein [Shewanella sp. YIC-542]|uniref:hypothetical protein n=1 Tax=Shewanella mytili TaxID=3377111 RepID=UPI00398EBBF5
MSQALRVITLWLVGIMLTLSLVAFSSAVSVTSPGLSASQPLLANTFSDSSIPALLPDELPESEPFVGHASVQLAGLKSANGLIHPGISPSCSLALAIFPQALTRAPPAFA